MYRLESAGLEERDQRDLLLEFLGPGGQAGMRCADAESILALSRVLTEYGFQPPGVFDEPSEEWLEQDLRLLREQCKVPKKYIDRFVERMEESPELEARYDHYMSEWIGALNKLATLQEKVLKRVDKFLRSKGWGDFDDEDPETIHEFLEELKAVAHGPGLRAEGMVKIR